MADFPGDGEGERSQIGVEGYDGAALAFAVEEEAFGDAALRDAENLLKANGLGAELHFVGAVGFGFAAFVFHGDDPPITVDFDDVADTGQPVALG